MRSSKKTTKGPIEVVLDVLRRENAESRPYHQKIRYRTEDETATVATALTAFNADPNLVDVDGNRIGHIAWECSCLQKKCGACAMVIDGRPQLACNCFLKDFTQKKEIRVEPLSKFPVVTDLIVDRSILRENLKTMRLWSNEAVRFSKKDIDLAYEASRCLQCGCCLEVCPNVCPGESFYGAAAFVPTARLISSMSGEEKEQLQQAYKEHIYSGCGKSLACADICPAGIDMDAMMVRSNAISIWKRRGKRR